MTTLHIAKPIEDQNVEACQASQSREQESQIRVSDPEIQSEILINAFRARMSRNLAAYRFLAGR